MDRLTNQRRSVWLSVLLAAATVATFWPALWNGFINYDDPDYVTENREVRAGITLNGLGWAFTTGHAANWHPITWISHMVDVQVFGVNPAGHHAVNLALHVVNSVLLFLLLEKLTGATWRSAVVAFLFALHPMHVQSVAWVAERKDVLSGLFFMLTLWAYAEYVNAECGMRSAECGVRTRRAYVFYGCSVFFFVLGLMSKSMLVTVPFLLLLLDYWPLQRLTLEKTNSGIARLILEKLPYLALSAVSSVLTIHFQRMGGAVEVLQNLSIRDRLANAAISYIRYLGKLLWPTHLAVFYPRTPSARWHVWTCGVLIIVVSIVCLIGLARSFRKAAVDENRGFSLGNFPLHLSPYITVGWCWFVGTLIPVIGLVQVGSQSMADRYTYIPSIGLFIAVVWLGANALSKVRSERTRRILYAAPCLLGLTVVALSTNQQVLYWRNSETLFRHALQVAPDNCIARFSLGKALVETGRTKEGGVELQRALELAPDFGKARGQLALALSLQGKAAEAAQQYELTLQGNPNQIEALNNLAWLRATNPDSSLRNGPEAVQLAERACELTGYQKTVFVGTLAAAYAEAGRFADAVTTAQRAIASAEAWNQQELADKNRHLLEFYRANAAYHEAP